MRDMSSSSSSSTTRKTKEKLTRPPSPTPPRDEALPLWLLLLKHSQGIVTASMTVGVLYYHNTHAIYLTCTSLATSFLAKGLKKIIKQPRPEGSVVQTPGMPSTHSATGTYIALYLAVLVALPTGAYDPPWLVAPFAQTLIVPSLVTFPALMMYSRVRLGVHTPAQCFVGAALGCVCTAAFTTLWRGSDAAGSISSSSSQHGWASIVQAGLAHAPVTPKLDALLHHYVLALRGVVRL